MATAKKISKRRGVWIRRFVYFIGFAALLWFAPALVALTPLRNTIARHIFADLKGTVTVGSASLGWLSPLVLHDVELHDEHGQLVLQTSRISSSHSVMQLLNDKTHLGGFRFDRPTVHWRFTQDTSNIEKVFAVWLFPTSSEGGEGVEVEVEFADAILHVHDETSDRQWRVEPVQASLVVPKTFAKPFRIEVDGKFTDGVTGRLRVKMQMQEAATTPCEGKVALLVERLPMAMLKPLLLRLQPQSEIGGRLDCKLQLQWQEGENAFGKIAGSVNAQNVNLAGPWLHGESLRLSRLQMPYHVSWKAGQWTVHQADLTCDLGTVSAQGTWNPAQDPVRWLVRSGIKIDLNADLAKLAEQLPKTLRLQKDTKLLAGKVSAQLDTFADDNGIVWQGTLHTTDLQGVNQGRFFRWKNPISLTFRGRPQPDAQLPILEEFHCQSEFLNIQGSGHPQQWQLYAQYDLDRLFKEIAPFVDLGSVRLSGNGQTNVKIREEKDGLFLQSDTQLKNLMVTGMADVPIQEKSLAIYLNAAGRRHFDSDERTFELTTANVRLQLGNDQLDSALLSPVRDVFEPLSSPVRFQLQGDLSRWQRRLEPFVPALKQILLRGQGEMVTKLQVTGSKIEFDETRMAMRDLHAHGYGVRINEKQMDLRTSGSWNAGQLNLGETTLSSSAVTMTMSELRLDASSTPLRLETIVSANGDLASLQEWLQDPSRPGTPLRGAFRGTVQVKTKGEQIGFKIDADLKQFASGPVAKPTVVLDELTANGHGVWNTKDDTVQIDVVHVETPFAVCDASGKIEEMSLAKRFTVAGQLRYDWEKLQPLLRPYVGKDLQMAGKGTKPFQLHGTLVNGIATLPKWTGSFEMDWQSANAHGIVVGPAAVQAKLKEGWLRFAPIKTSVNEGRLSVTPHLRLQPGPLELYVEKGKVLDNVKITPKMCANVLQYVSPALNGLAEAQGKLSMDMDFCRVDLAKPAESRVAGKMTLHAAELAATPMIRDLATLLRTKPSVGIEKESVVTFQLYQGRVYHENLGLVFPNVTVRTRGSIGLDSKLALLAEFPVPKSWLGDRPIAKALTKQTIRVPIGGTLERPQLDRNALSSITQQFLRETTRDVIRDELKNRLKGIFGPK